MVRGGCALHTDPGILPNENGKWLLEFGGQYSNRQPVYFLNHIPLNITSSIHSITFLPLSWDGNISCQGGWVDCGEGLPQRRMV